LTRDYGFFSLDSAYKIVTLRNGSQIEVINSNILKDSFYDGYNLGNAGNNLSSFENNAFVDVGAFNVNGSIETVSFAYPELNILDFELRKGSSITSANKIFNLAIPSINEIGTILSSSITSVDTQMTIGYANSLPNSGRIIINKEVIQYASKSGNTLFGLIRGANNTIASSHDANDYLRSF